MYRDCPKKHKDAFVMDIIIHWFAAELVLHMDDEFIDD